jgi:hypothetical protein
VDKVSGATCRSVGLLVGRIHLAGTSRTLVGGDPWVPMSLMANLVIMPLRSGMRISWYFFELRE